MAVREKPYPRRQLGATIVEFGLIAPIVLFLILGILDFGRLFFAYNAMQEITRTIARNAVVNGTSSTDAVINGGLFGLAAIPGIPEITTENIQVRYLRSNLSEITTLPENLQAECITGGNDCIAFVQVQITGAQYVPFVQYMLKPIAGDEVIDVTFDLPASSVTMPAESMGIE